MIQPYYTNGTSPKQHYVKNLRWAVTRMGKITPTSVEIVAYQLPRQANGAECRLVIKWADGMTFHAEFASLRICRFWIYRRRALYGVPYDFYTVGYGVYSNLCHVKPVYS